MIKILPEIQVEEEDSPLLLNFKQSEGNVPASTNDIKQTARAKDKNQLDKSKKA